MGVEKARLDSEVEKLKTKKRVIEIDTQNKENEVENLRQRSLKEREDFEQDYREK